MIWEQPTVTIESGVNGKRYKTFIPDSLHDPHGYVERFATYSELIYGSQKGIAFKSRMVCNLPTRSNTDSLIPAGATIGPGQAVTPDVAPAKYVFTPLED